MHVASYNIDYVISRTYLLYKLVRVVRHFIIPLLFIFVVICVARRKSISIYFPGYRYEILVELRGGILVCHA